MAGTRRYSTGPSRRTGVDSKTRYAYIAVAAVVGVAAIVLFTGVILTVVLPPRAHVLRVGDRDFSANDVARRAEYAIRFANDSAAFSNPARTAMDAIAKDEILRTAGAALVDPVTDDDLNAELRKRLGVADDADQATFASSYQAFLQSIPLSRSEFEGLIRAQLIQTRLDTHFADAVAEAGPQVHLLVARSTDQAALEEFRTAVTEGADFAEEASARGLTTGSGSQDLGWFDPESVPERARDAVTNTGAGSVTDVIQDPASGNYEVYLVSERTEDQPYDDAVRQQIAQRNEQAFFDQQESALVTEDLSSGESNWIRDRVVGKVLG